MALQSIDGGGVWSDPWVFSAIVFGTSTYVVDATSEKAVVVLRCPKAGTLDRFDFLLGTVTNSPDNGLRASFQGVNAADGQNDGTILGATNNAFVTYAHTVTTGWKSTDFGETVNVTRGQLIACVVDIPSFTASDSVTLSVFAGMSSTHAFPYGISITGTKQTGLLPIIVLHYTDGYVYVSESTFGVTNHASIGAFHVNTATADEWGLAFQVPAPCTLDKIAVQLAVAAGANFEVLVYDSDGTTVLSTLTHDGDVTGLATSALYILPLGTAVTLLANTTYRVTCRPTTTNTINMQYLEFASAALMDTLPLGSAAYMTSQINQGGTWTNYNSGTFRRPRIALHLTAFDDSVSAGAGPRARYQMGMA